MSKSKKWAVGLLMVICICLGFSMSVFAAGKGVRTKKTFPKSTEKTRNSCNVFFGGTQKAASRPTKSMKLSCTLYIPASSLKKPHDFFQFDPHVNMYDSKGEYCGSIFGKFRVQLELNEKKQPVLLKGTDNGVAKLNKKYASVTKKNGYYVVRLKNLPLCNWAFDLFPENVIDINTAKTMHYETCVNVSRHGSGKWTGYIYADDFILNAKKTIKMTFDKKDYTSVSAYNPFEDEKLTAAVKKLPF